MNTGTNYIDLIARLRDYVHSTNDCALRVEAADAIERALPAITSWNNPDALRTRISFLTTPQFSPTDSCDSPEAPLS